MSDEREPTADEAAALHRALRASVEVVEDPRIAELEAENARLRKSRDTYRRVKDELLARNTRLRTALASARDAMRTAGHNVQVAAMANADMPAGDVGDFGDETANLYTAANAADAALGADDDK